MAVRSPVIPVVFLLILLLFAVWGPSHQTSAIATSSPPVADTQEDFVPDEEQKRNYWAQGGNDVVHEVWSILRDFEPTWKDSVTPAHPSGLAQTLWHYTRVIFRALFMNAPPRHDADHNTPTITGDLKKGIETLQTAAAFDDPDAIFLLAEMNFYGNFSHPRNVPEAMRQYQILADLDGNSTAQHMLGLIYATGIGGVPRDQPKALLYHTFAADQGDLQSQLTLAFHHHAGIGCPRDCNRAVGYYKTVADRAMAYWQSGPPGGHALPRNVYRWVEMDGGIYGEGASVSSSGPNAPRDGLTTAPVDYVLDYLDMKERQGDYNAMLTLGKQYYEAPRGYKRNLRKAQRQFMKVARAYWAKDGSVNPKAPKGIERVAAKAAAYIGRMLLRGEGMEQNFDKALIWFKRGLANGDSFAQYHMGLMYRDGLGVPQDGGRAGTYLMAAAEQSLPVAQSALGVLFLDQGDVDTARRYFELAAGAGIMESFYYLAELYNQGVIRERNCGLASLYYKVVAERAEVLHSPFAEANAAYERGDMERAFVATVIAAEHGYENAQANVAYLLDRHTSVVRVPGLPTWWPWSSWWPHLHPARRTRDLLDDPELALAYFTRSAKQANVDSLIKMGDYYLAFPSTVPASSRATGDDVADDDDDTDADGRATVKPPSNHLDKATACYTQAAESHYSAQALWNLGWMHENGIGSVTQDFHMAKRYYDLALEMNKEAYLPVTLALTKLRLRSWWNGVSGGQINSIHDDEDEDRRRPKTWTEWINRFLDAAEEMDAQEAAALARERDGDDEFLGYVEPGMPGGDDDYAAREGRGRTAGNAPGGGVADEVYGADEWDEFDDGLVESVIIIALAGALALLVYARQARQRGLEAERRPQQQQPPQPPPQQQRPEPPPEQPQDGDRGLFPRPGDPELNNWVAGGIGH